MANVFGASEKAHVIKVDKAIVKIGSTTAIALGVTVSYQRAVQQLPVLSDTEVLSIGKATGTITANTVLMKGDGDIMSNPMFTGDGCKLETVTVRYQDGSCDSKNVPITCKNCIASALSVTAQGGQGYIASSVTINFTALELK